MYTTYPLPPIDTLNSHGGLVLFALIWVLGSGFVVVTFFDWILDHVAGKITWFITYIVPVGIVAYYSFTTGEITERKNEKVTGQFVKFMAEGYNEEVRSGKSTRRQDVHLLYAVYRIEGKLVPIQVEPGVPMPENAVFYKN